MRAFVLAVSIVGTPTAVLAQAAIPGTLLDSSGAAVAEVIVKATSPEQPFTILTPGLFKITAEIDL